MLELADLVFLLLSVTEFIVGMVGNGFIGLINGRSWLKSKRISLSDFIITNLAISRIILLLILLTDSFIMVFFVKLHETGIVMQVIDLFWAFTNHLNIWLTACLSVLYCLKITSFSHSMFLWLKWRVSRVVMWMLLGTLLLSCGSAMSLMHEFKIYSDFSGIDDTGNMTEHFRKKKSTYELIHVLGTLWNLPPLVVSLASYLLLIFSLGRHMQQMQHNGTSSRDPSTEAHKKAIRIILSSLFLFLLYFLAFLILSSNYFILETKMTLMIGEVITMFFPTSHTFIFILGNEKLKKTFLELLWCESGHIKPGSKETFSP